MELKFIINDYVLIWNILFQPSYSDEINNLKMKLWNLYKDEYNSTFNDKDEIFKDYQNFIPDNDLIYNFIKEQKKYTKLKKEVETYRKNILKEWDKHKKVINEILRKNIQKNINPYEIFIVSKKLNLIDATIKNNKTRGILVVGKDDNNLNILLNIILFILRKEIPLKNENDIVTKAIIELLVLNEIPTIITDSSYYISGNPALIDFKRKIYPYWLMFLGVKKEDFAKYMRRDKIAFNIDNYKYNKYLSRIDLHEFIDYIYELNENNKI